MLGMRECVCEYIRACVIKQSLRLQLIIYFFGLYDMLNVTIYFLCMYIIRGGLYAIGYAVFNSTFLLSVLTVVDAYHNLSEIYISNAIRVS